MFGGLLEGYGRLRKKKKKIVENIAFVKCSLQVKRKFWKKQQQKNITTETAKNLSFKIGFPEKHKQSFWLCPCMHVCVLDRKS